MQNKIQERTAPFGGRNEHFRSIAYALSESRPHFDAVHTVSLMATHAPSTTGRNIACGNTPLGDRRPSVDFVRSSYLGLDNHPVIVAGAIEAQRALHSSSIRTQISFDPLKKLEATLSEMFSARVLVFSSGAVANLLALPILGSGRLTDGIKPVVVFDRFADLSLAYHKPAVGSETQVEMIEHNDLDALERMCRKNPSVAYVCDGVYSEGGYSPIQELRQLQHRYGLFLYINDANGISIFGREGEGFARSQFPAVLGERTIIAASLAKGFGASGGLLMVGTADHETLFRRYCQPYAFSLAPNLTAVGAALGSCKVHRSAELRQRQERLAQRLDLFDRRVATAAQGNPFPIRPIALRSEANAIAIARGLLDCGFCTLLIPRAGQGYAEIQVCVTAEHETRDIERLCDCILEQVVETTGKPYPLR
ncbi:aminotransferase class I/II-fold pyridoxal phosphate-dependent enzyme [Bradyrhizobium sp. 193]|uniref:aminotransferase class I/II-fold pyridoxal phosphate-dependent enzyme n=1 Tax=Bradyrhizobium sp. 193 TaxID=2782661 RepID=UPI002111BEB1|nr:aminotransferase class I/II-fold pyridoxal phosphate-dependent enzyme [Bradyrhizobium sp. 193]MCK1486078.1 aminotransferase class I/II-fold pyridoxal phosphate-dependent enzyme [Bradyrhizobium sp. 193]